jgi:hypothetical protein
MNGQLFYLGYNEIMQYPNLGSLFPQQGQINPYKAGSDLMFVGGNYFDPITGQIIEDSRSKKDMIKNPFNIHLGNVINPFIDYSPLNKMANMGMDRSGSLLNG